MMPRAFKLEVISKQIYFRGVRKTWETWNEKKEQEQRKAESLFFPIWKWHKTTCWKSINITLT